MEEAKQSGKRAREDDGEEFLLGRRALLGRNLHVRLLRQASYEQQLLRQQEREMMAQLHQQQQTERLLQSLQFPSLVANEAERARAAGVEEVAFDRSGFKYHGRVKALADSARENGLKF